MMLCPYQCITSGLTICPSVPHPWCYFDHSVRVWISLHIITVYFFSLTTNEQSVERQFKTVKYPASHQNASLEFAFTTFSRLSLELRKCCWRHLWGFWHTATRGMLCAFSLTSATCLVLRSYLSLRNSERGDSRHLSHKTWVLVWRRH